MKTTRRQFLVWAAVAMAGVTALGWGASTWRSFEGRLRRAGRLAEAYFEGHDRAAVLAVGAAWLALVAPARDEAALRIAFGRAVALLDEVDRSRVADDLHERVLADFRELRTVDVEGWTLSVTEVALAALLDLDED